MKTRRGLGILLTILIFTALFTINPLSIVEAATYGDYEYRLINEDTEVEITGYNGSEVDIIIPSEITGKSVTSIGDFVFVGKNLSSVDIPNSVTIIGDKAFITNQLTSIKLPDGITKIGNAAFENNQLTSVTIPDGVTLIYPYTFRNNKLTSITIPDGVRSIGERAFDTNQLTSITISDSVRSIGNNAFETNQLTNVLIPDSVTSIGIGAFSNNLITNVSIPYTTTYIGAYAFWSNFVSRIDTVIHGKLGSEAESYAISNRHTFISTYATSIAINGQDEKLYIDTLGGSLQMIASSEPKEALHKGIIWTVTPITGNAEIDQTGLLTAIKNGIVTVTATSKYDSGIKDSLDITITNQKGTDIGGLIVTDTIWDKSGSPYYVISDLVIDERAKLSIEPGVEVILQNHIKVLGTIELNGNEDENITINRPGSNINKIELTNLSQKNIIENTKFDNITLNISSNETVMNNIILNNGGILEVSGSNNIIKNSNLKKTSLKIDGQYNEVINSVIDDRSIVNYGLLISRGALYTKITNCTVKNIYQYGVMAYATMSEITDSHIIDNGSVGIYVDTSSSLYNFTIKNTEVKGNNTGILLKDSTGSVHLLGNNIYANDMGIMVDNQSLYKRSHIFKGNNIYSNDIGIRTNSIYNNEIAQNNIYNNLTYNLFAPYGLGTLDYSENYWGLLVEDEIKSTILDFYDDYDLYKVNVVPFLESPIKPIIAVESVNLNKEELELIEGSTDQLIATVLPEDAINKKVSWTSSNPLVATVDEAGLVTAIAEGEATITVTTEDGNHTASCTVIVEKPIVEVESVSLNKANITLIEGATEALIATVLPEDATNKNIGWSSSNPSIVTVDETGLVTAVKEGETVITVTIEDGGYTANCLVKVEKPFIEVESVSINKKNITLLEGSSETLIATVLPEESTNKKVTWTSSNPSVATVDETGLVTALAEGEVLITVTTDDGGYISSCIVTVETNINWEIWAPQYNIEPDKTWTIEFNKIIDIKTIKENNIYVTDQNGQIISMYYYQRQQDIEKVIYIVPIKDYQSGQTYTLWIRDLMAEDGSMLSKNIKMQFTIRGSSKIGLNGISISPKTMELSYNGETRNIIATVLPTDATNKNITWLTSNSRVATVASGLVTAVGPGEATITAITEDGSFSASCVVSVMQINPKYNVIIDGISKEIDEDYLMYEEDNKLWVPLRFIAEALSAEVTWDNSTKEITFNKGEKTLQISINSNYATIKDGRTFCEIEYVSNALGYDIVWDLSSTTLIFTTVEF